MPLRRYLVVNDAHRCDHPVCGALGINVGLPADLDPVITARGGGDPAPRNSRSAGGDLSHRNGYGTEVVGMDSVGEV